MLDCHSRIAVYHETHYYPLFHSERARYGDLRAPKNLGRLIDDVREVIRVQGFLAPPRREEFLELLPEPTFEGVFAALLWINARRHGKARAADKTPGHHAYLSEILDRFPTSPVIFVMRDPRGAVPSIRLALRASLRSAARMWNEAFRSYSRFSRRVYLVQYESLVATPQETLQKVCAVLGEDFEEEMLRFSERVPERLAALPNFQKLLQDVDAGAADMFRRWPTEDLREIEALCGEGMESMGYAFSAGKVPAVSMPPPSMVRFALDRLCYYGIDRKRWRRGWMRWKILLRLRLRRPAEWHAR
jgi:hypothetical protein